MSMCSHGEERCSICYHHEDDTQAVRKIDKRASAFDQLKNNKFPVDPNFMWVCMDTRVMHPTEMRTSHLFNALKMIWNHNVPEKCIIQPFTEYRGARKWSREMRRSAVINLFNELMNRVDRTRGMNEALQRMKEMLDKWGTTLLDGKTN